MLQAEEIVDVLLQIMEHCLDGDSIDYEAFSRAREAVRRDPLVLASIVSGLRGIYATLGPNVPDDPILRKYCPACEPDHDESERYAYPQYCHNHQQPNSDGELDRLVDTLAYLSGTGEAGGKDNMLWCRFLHRNRDRETKKGVSN